MVLRMTWDPPTLQVIDRWAIESMSEVQLDCQNQPQQALHTIVEMVNALRTDRPLLGVGVAVPCPVVEGNLSEQILPAWKVYICSLHLKAC